MNRYWFLFEYLPDEEDDFDCSEQETQMVDAESQEQAEQWLFEYNLSHFSQQQIDSVNILNAKCLGEIVNENQLRFSL